MHLTIKKVLLWPKDTSKPIREIAFERGKVNVITGDSRSGKSALAAIIDYTLGSGKCAIPVGPIRDKTAWFGLLLETTDRQILITREEPEDRLASRYCYWQEGERIETPSRPQSNAGLEEVKGRLNQLALLSDLPLEDDQDRGFRLGRPSFRDLVAFNFLPQYIVANPYALFYKADRPDHREKLRAVFPLVLGVDTQNTLALRQEQRTLEKDLRPLETDLEQRDQTRKRWRGDAFGLWVKAQELGLLPPDARTPKGIDAILRDLRDIIAESEPPLPRPGAGEQAANRYTRLRERERELSAQIGDYKRRLTRLDSLNNAASGYTQALKAQQGRLAGLGWFAKHLSDSPACPMCGSEQDTARQELTRLQHLARELSRETQALARTPLVVDKERAEIRENLRDTEEQHRQIRQARLQIERATPRESHSDITLERVHRFVGRLEQVLVGQDGTDDDAALAEQIAAKRTRLEEIGRQMDSRSRKERLRTALAKVSRQLTENARLLELERAEEVIELDIQGLNLLFSNPDRNRKDLLSDLGSGENWMGYHIATFLALHQLFTNQRHSPVANFLVIDQPSQVYFPAEILDEHFDGERLVLDDKDKCATRRIFEALAMAIERIGGDFQIIVTEHADEDIWGDISGIALTERWRGSEDYLIPRDWLR